MKTLNLHIESLRLPGYSPAQQRSFVAALEQELARRCNTADAIPHPNTVPRVSANSTATATPADAARAVAALLAPPPATASALPPSQAMAANGSTNTNPNPNR